MDVLHAKTAATAAEVRALLADPPSYSAVRALLRILEDKGHVKHRKDGPRYVYSPCVSQKAASRFALKRILSTFFGGAVDNAVAALLDASDRKLSEAQLKRVREIINQAGKENKS